MAKSSTKDKNFPIAFIFIALVATLGIFLVKGFTITTQAISEAESFTPIVWVLPWLLLIILGIILGLFLLKRKS